MKIVQNNKSDDLTKKEKHSLFLLGLIFILGCFYVLGNRTEAFFEELTPEQSQIILSHMTDNRINQFFENLDLKASSVLIRSSDLDENIYAKDTEKVMPLASLVKIMTTIIAIENIDQNEVIKIPKESLGLAGDNGLLVDEKWGRDEFLRFMLITSSNDATRAVSMHVGAKNGFKDSEQSTKYFVDLMNKKATDMGLSNTYFLNESGLDQEDGKNGGYSNVKEIVVLFDYAIKNYPDIFNSTAVESQKFISSSSISHEALNTNPYTKLISGISASKTGFTNISGGNLIVSFVTPENKTIIAGVLGSTFADRFTDIEKLSNTTLKIINEVQ